MNNSLINGLPGEQLPVTDRALHYGDGVFETIAVINGAPRFWEQHLARLEKGCERLAIPAPDSNLLWNEVVGLTRNEMACVVKIIVTRGSGGRGYRPPPVVEPTRLVLRYPFPTYPPARAMEGVAIRLCDTPLGCNPRLAGIKHLNRLEQVLARSEWEDEAIAEGVMLDTDGHLIDGTMSNLFLVNEGRLYTPDLSHCGVEGVMRSVVIEVAQQNNIPVHIASLQQQMLGSAEEIFITNALIGIWPVIRCGENHYPIGPITQRLQNALASRMELSHA